MAIGDTMKMTALASGGMPGTNLSNTGPSQSKLASIKAIAAGEAPIQVTQTETSAQDKETPDVRRIKMRTNRSPDRDIAALEAALETVAPEAQGANPDTVVQTPVVEDTKPLSPQFAALAKERRAIQQERMAFEAQKKEWEAAKPKDGSFVSIDQLKARPLSVLLDNGVTYDQLTQELLGQASGITPEIQELKAELKALKEGVDKNLSDRDAAAEAQVLSDMQREAQALASQGETYELVREEKAIPHVMSLIKRTYKETGEVLDVEDAMGLVESELLNDNLRRIKFKKIQSQLTPAADQPVQRQNQMRTLTNRDSASPGLSRRERAILAMKGSTTKG